MDIEGLAHINTHQTGFTTEEVLNSQVDTMTATWHSPIFYSHSIWNSIYVNEVATVAETETKHGLNIMYLLLPEPV